MKAILTRFHGPSNVKGSRISAQAEKGQRVTIPVDPALNIDANHMLAARVLRTKMGWSGKLIGGTLGSGDMCWVFSAGSPSTK